MNKNIKYSFSKILFILGLLLLVSTNTCLAELSIKATQGLDKPLADYTPSLYKKAEVYASRGETVSFMLFVKSPSAQKLTASVFINKKNKKQKKIKVSFFDPQPVYVDENHKSYASATAGVYYDALLPLSVGSKVDAGSAGKWILVDIEVPSAVKAGTYTAKIQYGKKSLPVNLKVWKMLVPTTPVLPLYGEINPIAVDEGHYGEWRELSQINMDLYKQYIKTIRAHRMYPMRSWPRDSLYAPFEQGKNPPSLDLQSTHYFSTMIDGLPKGLKYDLPDANCYGPVSEDSYCNVNNLNADANRINYLKAMEQTIKDYSSYGLQTTSLIWDEPFMNAWQWQSEADYQADLVPIRSYLNRVKELVPSLKTVITSPCFQDLAGSVDVFVSAPDYMEEGYPHGGTFADCDAVRNKGVETWWYVSCMSHGCTTWDSDGKGTPDFVIERPAAYINSLAWLQAKYKFSAFYYYDLVLMYESYPAKAGGVDPWNDVYAHTGQGDGTLLYPGRAGEHGLTTHQPIMSIRVKQWRETSFTAEYINWMIKQKKQPKWWNSEFDSMVTSYNHWNKRYSQYYKIRKKMGEFLNKK